MNKNSILGLLISAMLTQVSCREPFEPILSSPQTGYLVVEGFINVKGITSVKLSRTKKLEETAAKPELKANLKIVGENLTEYDVKEKSNGVYESENLNLPNQKYQLIIKTADGKAYESKLVEVKITPPIDSVSWKREPNGVEIKVNSHDDQNRTKYYKWNFEEVWEIRSLIPVEYKFVRNNVPGSNETVVDVVKRTPKETADIYNCWQYRVSNQILLGSSAKLSEDVISSPINFIPNSNERLEILYSINVKQTALDLEGYNFFFDLKNNTETNGSIFDRQPSETVGNIICTSNRNEQVIGYVGVTTLEEKRIFIPNLLNWGYRYRCNSPVLEIPLHPDTLSKYSGIYEPLGIVYDGPRLAGYQVISNGCVDCTSRGNNTKPLFWPN